MNFLKLLVYEIRTVDGNLNSAEGICNALYKEAFKVFQKDKNVLEIGNKDKSKIMKLIDEQVMRKAVLKYKIMRIRIKISYSAFYENKTIVELIVTSILNSYMMMNDLPLELDENTLD